MSDKYREALRQRERAKGFADYRQYEVLAKLLQERGVMPSDLAALCALRYKTQYATLSRADADDLMASIANVPADQMAMRLWVSETVKGLMHGWVSPMEAEA